MTSDDDKPIPEWMITACATGMYVLFIIFAVLIYFLIRSL